jgi:hypothetical protein
MISASVLSAIVSSPAGKSKSDAIDVGDIYSSVQLAIAPQSPRIGSLLEMQQRRLRMFCATT